MHQASHLSRRWLDEKANEIHRQRYGQGLAVFIASFGTYFVFLRSNPENAALARTMGLSIIILANLFLVQVNSSNTDFALQSVKKLMKDKVMWGVDIVTIAGLLVILYTPISGFLKLMHNNAEVATH